MEMWVTCDKTPVRINLTGFCIYFPHPPDQHFQPDSNRRSVWEPPLPCTVHSGIEPQRDWG